MPQGFDRSALPDTMSAVQLTGHGGFECLRHISDLPVPRAGEGEVLVRVRAAAVNNTDINTRVGWYSKSVETATEAAMSAADARDGGWSGNPFHFPRIQGIDADIVIEAVFEDLAVKQQVLAECEAVLRPEALFATNTSTIPIGSIAALARHHGGRRQQEECQLGWLQQHRQHQRQCA